MCEYRDCYKIWTKILANPKGGARWICEKELMIIVSVFMLKRESLSYALVVQFGFVLMVSRSVKKRRNITTA